MPEKVENIPFHAVNEFMREDYRLTVLTEVLSGQEKIPAEQRSLIGKNIARYVSVPGFRNGNLAPVGRKAKASVTLFERSPEFTGAVLEGWSRLHPDLAKTVFAVLTDRGWEGLQPLELDRSQLPGFLIHWPKGDTYEELIKAAHEKDSQLQESDDNVSLMVVWVGNRLPYDLYADEAEEKKE
jgi:hypothetical protein